MNRRKIDIVNAKLDVLLAVSSKWNFLLKSFTCSTLVQLFYCILKSFFEEPWNSYKWLQRAKKMKNRRIYKFVERGKLSLGHKIASESR